MARMVFLFVTCMCFIVIGQNPLPAQQSRTFRFSSQLDDSKKTSFQIILDYDPENPLSGLQVANEQTDAQGRFSVEFDLKNGQAFVLLVGRQIYRMWAEPGEDLDLKKLTGSPIQLSGSIAKQNQFLFDCGLAIPEKTATEPTIDLVKFARKIGLKSNRQSALLETLIDHHSVSSRFRCYSAAQIIGNAANRKNMLPTLLISQKKISKNDLPQNYFKFWDSFPLLDDQNALVSRSYQNALRSKFQYLAEQELLKKNINPPDSIVEWTKTEISIQEKWLSKHPKTLELLFADKIMFMIQYLPARETSVALAKFKKRFPRSRYMKSIQSAIQQSQNIDLTKIDKAVNFVDAIGTKTSFAKLKGKVLYVDFWGLWCKGCMVQKPALEALIQQFKNEDDVVFLSINFFDDHESWKKYLNGKSLGTHWKPATANDETDAEKLFSISAFPRFMIFDKQGKLVTASASTPSNKSAADEIRRALLNSKK